MAKICNECGYPLNGNEDKCPECGTPCIKETKKNNTNIISTDNLNSPTDSDWANYVYESGVIFWNVFTKHFADSKGRASRREFWSFQIIAIFISAILPITVFAFVIPSICVGIRRVHDINKNGWWCICPFASLFLFFKKSDNDINSYGIYNPATNLL